jgi:hypothetical protein
MVTPTLAEVLDGGGETEFIAGATRPAQQQSIVVQDTVEAPKQHLEFFP